MSNQQHPVKPARQSTLARVDSLSFSLDSNLQALVAARTPHGQQLIRNTLEPTCSSPSPSHSPSSPGAAIGVGGAEELKIDVTLPVECDRPTKKGDRIDVHYRGTLQPDGSKFDASTFRLNMRDMLEATSLTPLPVQATIAAALSASNLAAAWSSRGSSPQVRGRADRVLITRG